jgi:hypothetical protein
LRQECEKNWVSVINNIGTYYTTKAHLASALTNVLTNVSVVIPFDFLYRVLLTMLDFTMYIIQEF